MITDKMLKAVAMPGDFIFHSSWFEIFKSFDMATAYAIFMAMIAYMQTGEIPADEELRRLTVFLFAHLDTDRRRILALQPKRRATAKTKDSAKAISEMPQDARNNQGTQDARQADHPKDAPSHLSLISVSDTPHSAPNTPKSHNTQAAPDVPQARQNIQIKQTKQPKRTPDARRARLTAFAHKVSDCIRRSKQLPDPKRVHKRNFKKRFKKSIPR